MMKKLSRAPRKINVMIVDDHPLFREGLEKALSLEDDLMTVGSATTGKEALNLIHKLQPDVILLDVNLPDVNGLQVAREIKSQSSDAAVIILTAYHEQEQVLYAMRAGASAYCAKDIRPDDLVQAIRDVAKGLYIIQNQRMERSELDDWIKQTVEALVGPYVEEPEQRFIPLSPRETEILISVTHGMSNKEIANELGISQQTVKNHMTSILRKLNVEDRTQAAVTAIRHGWVRLTDQNKSTEQGE
ncbi:MAG: response regulator transcription factor [Phototrophicales bacterium]